MTRPAARRTRIRVLVAVALVATGTLVAGCGQDTPAVPVLTMPDLVGQTVGAAESTTYDALHTSLLYSDGAPSAREVTNDWVVVSTSPPAGTRTPKFRTVTAVALRASEAAWFGEHATMPRIPSRIATAKLLGAGGLLHDVRDLVRLRYRPAKAGTATADLRPGKATGTLAVGSRPAAGADLEPGGFLTVLVVAAPKPRPKPTPTYGLGPGGIDVPSAPGATGGSSGGSTGGSTGGRLPGLPDGITIPGCPKSIC